MPLQRRGQYQGRGQYQRRDANKYWRGTLRRDLGMYDETGRVSRGDAEDAEKNFV